MVLWVVSNGLGARLHRQEKVLYTDTCERGSYHKQQTNATRRHRFEIGRLNLAFVWLHDCVRVCVCYSTQRKILCERESVVLFLQQNVVSAVFTCI